MTKSVKLRLLSAIPILAMITYFFFDWYRYSPQARETQLAVEAQLRELPAPNGATERAFQSFGKTHGGSATRVIAVSMQPKEVELFYDHFFRSAGWRVLKEELREDKFRDVFCFDGRSAVVSVPSEGQSGNTELDLTVAWGEAGQCD